MTIQQARQSRTYPTSSTLYNDGHICCIGVGLKHVAASQLYTPYYTFFKYGQSKWMCMWRETPNAEEYEKILRKALKRETIRFDFYFISSFFCVRFSIDAFPFLFAFQTHQIYYWCQIPRALYQIQNVLFLCSPWFGLSPDYAFVHFFTVWVVRASSILVMWK